MLVGNDGDSLRPGMFGRVSIELERHPQAITSDPAWMRLKKGRGYVRIVEDGQAKRVDTAQSQTLAARLKWVPEVVASTGFKRTDGQVQGSFGDFRDVDFQSVTPFGQLAWTLNPAEVYFRNDAAAQREQGRKAAALAVRRAVDPEDPAREGSDAGDTLGQLR